MTTLRPPPTRRLNAQEPQRAMRFPLRDLLLLTLLVAIASWAAVGCGYGYHIDGPISTGILVVLGVWLLSTAFVICLAARWSLRRSLVGCAIVLALFAARQTYFHRRYLQQRAEVHQIAAWAEQRRRLDGIYPDDLADYQWGDAEFADDLVYEASENGFELRYHPTGLENHSGLMHGFSSVAGDWYQDD